MPTSVAPAKDVNMGFQNLTEPRCMTPSILGFDILAFVLTHRTAFG
jgi:ABC-type enterochelin transport system permease subunit